MYNKKYHSKSFLKNYKFLSEILDKNIMPRDEQSKKQRGREIISHKNGEEDVSLRV